MRNMKTTKYENCMNMNKLKTLLTITAGAFALASSASAAIVIESSYVADVGNAASKSGYGGVSYSYYIGTYEVTNDQYASFLNATASTDTHGLYDPNMSSSLGGIERSGTSGNYTYSVKTGMGKKPVNYVSFWDAARFANWLTSGDTEVGVYNLGGVTNPDNTTITRDATAWSHGGVAIASEDEWYKAAYYKGGGTDAGYWRYAIQSDSITTADANYNTTAGAMKDVGAYRSAESAYGTFDQTGNVWEWHEALSNQESERDDRSSRGWRGAGSGTPESCVDSSVHTASNDPSEGYVHLGFRVTSLSAIAR